MKPPPVARPAGQRAKGPMTSRGRCSASERHHGNAARSIGCHDKAVVVGRGGRNAGRRGGATDGGKRRGGRSGRYRGVGLGLIDVLHLQFVAQGRDDNAIGRDGICPGPMCPPTARALPPKKQYQPCDGSCGESFPDRSGDRLAPGVGRAVRGHGCGPQGDESRGTILRGKNLSIGIVAGRNLQIRPPILAVKCGPGWRAGLRADRRPVGVHPAAAGPFPSE